LAYVTVSVAAQCNIPEPPGSSLSKPVGNNSASCMRYSQTSYAAPTPSLLSPPLGAVSQNVSGETCWKANFRPGVNPGLILPDKQAEPCIN